jgi:uncharacterized caspase-like protein
MPRLHAAFIGIDKYEDPTIADLRFARADAEALAATFEGSMHIEDLRFELLVDQHATRTNILDLVGRDIAGSVASDDLVLVYFAGHGSPEIYPDLDETSRFLVCHDSRRDALFSTGIDLASDVPRLLSRLRSRLQLFIFDACFSGYSGGRGIVGTHLERHRRLHRASARLRTLPLGRGTAVMSAASDDEVAIEPPSLRHGIFSYHLLHALSAPGPEGTVPIPTLYDTVFAEVNAFTQGRQNPVLWGTVAGAGLPRLRGWGS